MKKKEQVQSETPGYAILFSYQPQIYVSLYLISVLPSTRTVP
jgi:hypothetical protein